MIKYFTDIDVSANDNQNNLDIYKFFWFDLKAVKTGPIRLLFDPLNDKKFSIVLHARLNKCFYALNKTCLKQDSGLRDKNILKCD